MQSILSGLVGAVILAVGYFIAKGIVEAWRATKDLTTAFKGIPQLVKSNQEVASALHRFSGELEFLRTAMLGGTPPEAEPGATPAAPVPSTPSGKPIPQFPAWQPFVAAVDAPDAEESDTVVVDTTDEEFVEQEAIETIRGQGYAAGPEADPTENPPGVTASV